MKPNKRGQYLAEEVIEKTSSITEKKFLSEIKTGRSQSEIFNGIAASIRESYDGEMEEKKSRELARNLISFCQKIINIQIRQEYENEEKKQPY